jgi:simple sugar transport system permease protein
LKKELFFNSRFARKARLCPLPIKKFKFKKIKKDTTMPGKRYLILHRDVISFLIIIVLIIAFTLLSPDYSFLYADNIRNILAMGPEIALIVLGVSLLMIAGEFDLSVGSQLQFCMYVFWVLLYYGTGLNDWMSFFVTLGVGAVLGLINAVITIRGRIPSFITTLGTMLLWRGVVLLLTVGYMKPLVSVSPLFRSVFSSEVFGVPVQIIWFAAIAVVLGLILHRHRFGNWVYATGDNEMAAREMGINTALTKTICFMTVGILAALVSVLQLYRIESFAATQGIGFEFRAIAACVIGGISLRGGSGSMIGAILGIIAMQTIDTGLILIGAPVFGVDTFIGIVIVVFGLLVTMARRRPR